MSPERRARAELLRLEQEIRAHLVAMDRQRERIDLFASERGNHIEPVARWSALAVALHAYYCAVESALTRVARTIEGNLPSGSDWHRDLLRSMSLDLSDVRPAIISPETQASLARLLSFRHFFRHAYSVDFDADQLSDHARRVLAGHSRLVAELSLFADSLA